MEKNSAPLDDRSGFLSSLALARSLRSLYWYSGAPVAVPEEIGYFRCWVGFLSAPSSAIVPKERARCSSSSWPGSCASNMGMSYFQGSMSWRYTIMSRAWKGISPQGGFSKYSFCICLQNWDSHDVRTEKGKLREGDPFKFDTKVRTFLVDSHSNHRSLEVLKRFSLLSQACFASISRISWKSLNKTSASFRRFM